MKIPVGERVLIPLPGIGALSLTRAEYDAALIPSAPHEIPKSEPKPTRDAKPTPPQTGNASGQLPALRYIRLREVCQRVGLGQSTIYKLVMTGKFPKQVKLSERTSAWIESEVEAYMNARIVERDYQTPTGMSLASPYLRMGEVMKRTGLNHSTIYDLIRKGSFPKWADLPKRASGWLKTDIDAWLELHTDTSLATKAGLSKNAKNTSGS
jgi:prophage regulatory protein